MTGSGGFFAFAEYRQSFAHISNGNAANKAFSGPLRLWVRVHMLFEMLISSSQLHQQPHVATVCTNLQQEYVLVLSHETPMKYADV